jgi:hypothetical protein
MPRRAGEKYRGQTMRLTDLEPFFLQIEEPRRLYKQVDTLAEAQGVQFLCPKCFVDCGGSVGCHSVICWDATKGVTPEETPKPGRWQMLGTGLTDLTLRAGSSSVLLTGDGCKAHFFIEAGEIRMC